MIATGAGSRIGALWQQRIGALKEYEVVRDGNVFGTSFSNNYVWTSEYDRAQQHLAALIRRYEGVSFESLFSGEKIENEGGSYTCLTSRHPLTIVPFDTDRYTSDVLSDLTLVRGIGSATQRRLNGRGYTGISDLMEHPKFRNAAAGVLRCLSGGDPAAIMDLVARRHTKAHSLVLGAAGFFAPEDYVFLDIETLGLFSRPIVLFGVGTIEGNDLIVRQYLLRDINEEPAALLATLGHLSGDRPVLVTFNGKSFDLPYLQDRLAYYGLGTAQGIPHFDVLHFSRRRWKGEYPSFCLAVLERDVLGVERAEDIPGQMVPEFYETFLRTGNCGPLVPVVGHNCQDVVSLALLFSRLLGESYGCR